MAISVNLRPNIQTKPQFRLESNSVPRTYLSSSIHPKTPATLPASLATKAHTVVDLQTAPILPSSTSSPLPENAAPVRPRAVCVFPARNRNRVPVPGQGPRTIRVKLGMTKTNRQSLTSPSSLARALHSPWLHPRNRRRILCGLVRQICRLIPSLI